MTWTLLMKIGMSSWVDWDTHWPYPAFITEARYNMT